MQPRKKLKCDLKDEESLKFVELIDKDDFAELLEKLDKNVVGRAVYPDGTESSKTRLVYYAIKKGKIESLRAFAYWGLNFKAEFPNVPNSPPDFASVSPIHYCIEKKCPIEALNFLLEQDTVVGKSVQESYIRAAVMANNYPALEKLFFVYRNCFDLPSVLSWYSRNRNIQILKCLEIASAKFAALGVRSNRHQSIFGLPTLAYLSRRAMAYSLEECDLVVRLCKTIGCRVNARQKQKSSLHIAIESNNINFAKALVKNGAIVNSLNANGRTPLFEAMMLNEEDLFKFILQYEGDSRIHNSDSDCVLYYAIRKQDCNKISQIIKLDKNLNVSAKTDDFDSNVPPAFFILQYLTESEVPHISPDFLKTVITTCMEMNFDINTKWPRCQQIKGINFRGHTVMHLAIRFFDANFCKELISLGAELDLLTDYNQCPRSLTVDYVLGTFGDEEYSDKNLQKFSFIKNHAIAWNTKLPLPHNPEFPVYRPNRRFLYLSDNNPRTPIQAFLKHKKSGLLLLLFPSLVLPGTLGTEEVKMAFRTGSFRITYLVLQELWKDLSLITVPVANIKHLFHDEEIMDYKLTFEDSSMETTVLQTISRRGFEINSADDNGNGIFHYAARSRKFTGEESVKNFFEVMISIGGEQSIDLCNKKLQSPLYWALSFKKSQGINPHSVQFVQLFLKHGADFRRKTTLGSSAIHIAVNSGSSSFVELLVEKSGPKKNVVNLWRRLRYAAKGSSVDDIDEIEEITWPLGAIEKTYTVTPLTVAIMNNDKEMVKLLMSHGAMLAMKDIHNSLYLSSFKDLNLANFLFEFFPKDHPLNCDRMENNAPSLDYILCKLSEQHDYDCDAVMTLTKNYLSRKYDINIKDPSPATPPILVTLIKMALAGKGNALENIKLFNYLMEYSDCEFVSFPDNPFHESLLTFLFSNRFCIHTCVHRHSSLFDRDKRRRRIAPQRKYFIRKLLQRCLYHKWEACHFNQYIYHLEDKELIKHILLTGACPNLRREFRTAEVCPFVGTDRFDTVNELLTLQLRCHLPSLSPESMILSNLAVMAIGNISKDLRTALTSVALPDSTMQIVKFLDVETDEELATEIENAEFATSASQTR